jgi:adenylate kinase family enzyme
MKRILIIGRSGAGKTTFTDKLGKALGREVIHLDNLFWKPGWVRAYNTEEWEKKVQELIQKNEWILDGNYHNTLEMRLQRADVVIFFDINPFQALANALKRKFFPSVGSGDKVPKLHSEVRFQNLARSIFKFPTKKVQKQVEKAAIKNIFVIRNRKEIEQTLQELTMNSK